MSLDCVGKLACLDLDTARSRSIEIARDHNVGLFFELDDEDQKTLDAVPLLQGPGLYFTISHDCARCDDATPLWCEAYEVARKHAGRSSGERVRWRDAWSLDIGGSYLEAVGSTRLGATLGRLFGMESVSSVGVALIDGCVDRVYFGNEGVCIDRILRSFLVGWDVGPNALYVLDRSAPEAGWLSELG